MSTALKTLIIKIGNWHGIAHSQGLAAATRCGDGGQHGDRRRSHCDSPRLLPATAGRSGSARWPPVGTIACWTSRSPPGGRRTSGNGDPAIQVPTL